MSDEVIHDEIIVDDHITGAGGGGKGGGGGTGGNEAPNNLVSNARARIIDLISEGPIDGLVNGTRSIYFDDTPLTNDSGKRNFDGVHWNQRFGTPDQTYITRFPAAENEVSVNVEVKNGVPVVRTITDPGIDSVRVKVGVPALLQTNDDGDIVNSTVRFRIDRANNGGSFQTVANATIRGKTNSPYEREWNVRLPEGGAPWTIRVVRITPDSEETRLRNSTVFYAYTEIVDAKLTYPDSALIAFDVNAKDFGDSVPERTYHVRGLITKVPSNYNPITREYTGLWNGTFKNAWHNNPAWVMYDLMTNKRYGMGDFIPPAAVDKFALYEIARYCDEMVPDGAGGQEPRYTFNGVIRDKQEAARALDQLASTFRGMIYFGAGVVTAVQDRPGAVQKIVTNANVIDGDFNYAGSPVSSRHTSVAVKYNNNIENGRPSVTIVQNDKLMQKYGDRRKDAIAIGCTSLGQAQRIGKWLLYTEEHETEIVTYRASFDHAAVRPGDIIELHDNNYAGIRHGGRLVGVPTNSRVVLDEPIEFKSGQTYSITLTGEDGRVTTVGVNNPQTTTATVNLSRALTAAEKPMVQSTFIVSSSEVTPRKFRILANVEKSPSVYEISALLHKDGKYDFVDNGANLKNNIHSVYDVDDYREGVEPIRNLSVSQSLKQRAGTRPDLRFVASWTRSTTPDVVYEVWIKEPESPWDKVTTTSVHSATILSDTDTTGDYTIRVFAVGGGAKRSEYVEVTETVNQIGLIPQVPANWSGTGGHDHVTLEGDAAPEKDFAYFKVYAKTAAQASGAVIGKTRSSTFTRSVQPNGADNYYAISSVSQTGHESALTPYFLVERVPVRLADADDSIANAIAEAVSDAADADSKAQAVRSDLDDLVEDFTGNLQTRFLGIDADIAAADDRIDAIDGSIAEAVAQAGVKNVGFEECVANQIRVVPPGWIGRNVDLSDIGVHGARPGSTGTKSFGQTDPALVNTYWWIGKRFDARSGQSFSVSVYADVAGNIQGGSNNSFVGSKDLVIQFLWFDGNREEISRVTSESAVWQYHSDTGETSVDTWVNTQLNDIVAPDDTRFVEVRFVVLNGGNSNTTIQDDYSNVGAANASVVLDDAEFTSNALVLEIPSTTTDLETFIDGDIDRLTFDLTASIDATNQSLSSVQATLTQDYYTRAATDTAISNATTTLSAEIDGVAADLSNNYYTVAQADSAIAAAGTSLSSRIDDVEADLSTNYYTIAGVDSAISEAGTTLTARIDNIETEVAANYYTIADTDSAIAAATTTISSRVDDVEADLQTNYYTSADTDSAISAATTTISSRVDDVEADLQTNYYTSVDTDSAISAATTTISSRVDDVEADLQTNYYTIAGADSAITAATSTLSSRVDNVESDLSTNYYTSADTDEAISALETRLTAQSGGVGYGFEEGEIGTKGPPAGWRLLGGTDDNARAALGYLDEVRSASDGSKSYGTLQSGTQPGPWWYISKTFYAEPGATFDVITYASTYGTVPSSNPGQHYAGEDDAFLHFIFRDQSGTIVEQSASKSAIYQDYESSGNTPGAYGREWRSLSGAVTAPANTRTLEVRLVAIDNDDQPASPSKMDYTNYVGHAATAFDDFEITSSGEIVEQDEIRSALDDILALNVSPDSAFGTFLTDISVDVGQNSAEVGTLGTAVADLQGNASAGYLIKAQAGGAVSLLDLIAADNPLSGPTSIAKIAADDILLDGSVAAKKMLISDFSNFVPEGGLADAQQVADLWSISPTDPDLRVLANDLASGTAVDGEMPASNALYFDSGSYKYTDLTLANKIPVKAGEKFFLSVDACGASSPNRRVRITVQLRHKDGSAASTNGTNTLEFTCNFETYQTKTLAFTVPAGYIGIYAFAVRVDAGSGFVALTNFRCYRQNAGELVVDGGITSNKIDTNSFQSSGLAVFGGYMRSSNFSSGSQGWQIHQNGNAEFNRLIARKDIKIGGVDLENIVENAITNTFTLFDGDAVNLQLQQDATTLVLGYGRYFVKVGASTSNSATLELTAKNLDTNAIARAEETLTEPSINNGGRSHWGSMSVMKVMNLAPTTFRFSNLSRVTGGQSSIVSSILVVHIKR